MTCRVCGAESVDAGARSCDECGALLHADAAGPARETRPAPAASAHPSSSANQQLIVWGAMALAGIATVALLAIAVNSIFGSAEAPAASTSSTSTAVATHPGGEPFGLFDHPVTEPVTILAPHTGERVQYYREGVLVTFLIGGGDCGGEVMTGVSGTIRNESKASQPLEYIIGVDLIRAFTGSKIAHVEAEVGPVEPGETATWSAEGVVGQVVTLRCELTDITVLPAGSL